MAGVVGAVILWDWQVLRPWGHVPWAWSSSWFAPQFSDHEISQPSTACERDVISISTSPDWHISSDNRIQMLKYDFTSHLFHSFDYDLSSILNLPMKWVEKLFVSVVLDPHWGLRQACHRKGAIRANTSTSALSQQDETRLLSRFTASGWWWRLHLNCVLRVWQSRA